MTTTFLSYDQEQARNKLREMLEKLVEGLMNGMVVLYNHKMSYTSQAINKSSNLRLRRAAIQMRCALILYHELSCQRRIQKRDLFYRDVRLFKRQHVSDRVIEFLTRACGVPREAMNVVGASRGLMYGGWLRLMTSCGGVNDVVANGHKHVVPYTLDINSLDGDLDFVLIVEKEAVFELIMAGWQQVYEELGKRPFLVVTAKGYPDRATSLFLGMLRMQRPCTRFLALVDWDPFGMDICLRYKKGLRDTFCAINDLELLGLRREDVRQTVPLDLHDKRKMYSLLRSTDDELVRRELLCMNDMNGKMEIDVLANHDHALSSFTHDHLIPALQKSLL